MAKRDSSWLKLLEDFVKDLRISSKEVTSEDDRGVKLVLWGSQTRFLKELAYGLEDGIRYYLVCKSRQLGLTTISVAIDVFWLAMHAHLPGALVSDSDKNRKKNRALVQRYTNSLPDGYFGESFRIVKANDSFIQFSNGSKLDLLVAGTKAKAATAWGEGEGYAFAHMTERAKYGDPDALASFEESLAQKNPHRLFISESTANGFNHFKASWDEAKRDTHTKRAIFIGWWASEMNRIEKNDPRFREYGLYPAAGEERELKQAVWSQYGVEIQAEQLAWIRWKDADSSGADPMLINQNQPWVDTQAYIMTGYSFFQTRMISKEMAKLEDEALPMRPYYYELGVDFFNVGLVAVTKEEERDRIELKIWEEPVEGARYVIGCDPAFGRNSNKDRHAITIWRCFSDRLVQVAEYATSEVEVKHCTWVLAHLAGAYKDCMVNLELTGPGRMVMQEFDHLRQMMNAEMNATITRERGWDDALGMARWYLYHRADSQGGGYAWNFETSWRTKAEIMHQMRGAYVTNELTIRSLHLLHEMSLVVQDGDHIGAPESKSENAKDDRVFAAALAIRAWINWVRPDMLAQGMTYERVMEKETGQNTLPSRLNDQVWRFFKRKDDEAEAAALVPTWRSIRGL